MTTLINANNSEWNAADVALYTVICADDGNRYISNSQNEWEMFEEPCVLNDDLVGCSSSQEEKLITHEVPKPKRVTAYNMFLQNAMKELKSKRPDLPCRERMKLAAQMWHEYKANL